MYEVSFTEVFQDWLDDLRDHVGQQKILSRVARFRSGNLGDVKNLGEGVWEARVMGKGAGYRLYYGFEGERIILLLIGGDKASQTRDIACAKKMWVGR